MNFSVVYDPSVAVPAEDAERGDLLTGDAIFRANPNQSGRILFGFARRAGLDRTGTVAVVPFRVVGQPGDVTLLTLDEIETQGAGGESLPIGLEHGEIRIVREAVKGDCTGDGVVDAADAMCALEISVELRPTMAQMDVDENGKVTSGDARQILSNVRSGGAP